MAGDLCYSHDMRTKAAITEITRCDRIETADGDEGTTIRVRLTDGLWYEDGDANEEGWTDKEIHKISDALKGWASKREIFDYSTNYAKWIESDGE